MCNVVSVRTRSARAKVLAARSVISPTSDTMAQSGSHAVSKCLPNAARAGDVSLSAPSPGLSNTQTMRWPDVVIKMGDSSCRSTISAITRALW